jgi:protease IV
MTRKMTDEERAKFQANIDDSFKRFKDIVAFGRPKLAQAEIDKVATGEIFTTNQAVALKLVDEEGFIEDAISQAIKIANLSAENVRVIQYERPQTLMNALTDIDAQAAMAPRSNLEMLLDMTTPRAYYLFSSLPSVAVLGPKAE